MPEMNDYDTFRFSITCHTDDDAFLNCSPSFVSMGGRTHKAADWMGR